MPAVALLLTPPLRLPLFPPPLLALQAVRAAEKAPARTIPDADYVATKLHLAVNLAEKASAPEAELALQVRGQDSEGAKGRGKRESGMSRRGNQGEEYGW